MIEDTLFRAVGARGRRGVLGNSSPDFGRSDNPIPTGGQINS